MTSVTCLFFGGSQRPLGAAIGIVLTLVGGLVSCRSAAPVESAFCGQVVIEDLDPLSVQHVLPGAEVTYLTSPPTSGPHLGGAAPSGVLDTPLVESMQVTILEGGRTLVQYQPDLPPSQLEALRDIAGLRIVVAPNAAIDSPVIATRWRAKLTCTQVAPAALQAFSVQTDLPETEAD